MSGLKIEDVSLRHKEKHVYTLLHHEKHSMKNMMHREKHYENIHKKN